jgi:hypothetical protein
MNDQSPKSVSDDEFEKLVQEKGMTAPRVTLEAVHTCIAATDYYVFPGSQLTICCLTLDNGFTVTGESACASPENFDAEIGRKIAYSKAIEKIWPLLGFRLKDRLAREEQVNANPLGTNLYEVARIAYEINRAYCQAIGDHSQPSWDDAPKWQKDSPIAGVRFHAENPGSTPEASHENWMKQKLAEGWVYGEVKNPDAKTHPCIRPYYELHLTQRVKDHLFIAVVHALLN